MDVSGSMGEEQKELVRLESFWIDTWLRKNYEGIESRYIVHDVSAKEVDKHTFYHLREDGGTKISSAFKHLPSSCSTPTTRPTSGTSTSSTSPTATTAPKPTAATA